MQGMLWLIPTGDDALPFEQDNNQPVNRQIKPELEFPKGHHHGED